MRRSWTAVVATLVVASALALAGGSTRPAKADGDPVLFAAGDIGNCNGPGDEATGALIKAGVAQNPNSKIAMLGDGTYPDGSLQSYQQCYDPNWGGSLVARTLPTPGNHDYGQVAGPSDAGYRQYFDSVLQPLQAAGGQTLADNTGWYSYDLGDWHIISLNWDCTQAQGCSAGNPQTQFLASELQKAQGKCILTFWHGARFFSRDHTLTEAPRGPSIDTKTNLWWKMLQAAGADVVLSGHQHIYERFDHMSVVEPAGAPTGDTQGQVDPAGPRQFVVGTGGGEHGIFDGTTRAVGSQVALDNQFGVLKMTLHAGSYDWQFLSSGTTGEPAAGNVLDQGSDACHASGPSGTTTTSSGTTATTAPTTTPTTAPVSGQTPPAPGAQKGYWMVGADGKVFGFGQAKVMGDATPTPGAGAADLEPTPSGQGYWIVDSAGKVSAFGDAVLHGMPDSLTLAAGEKVTSLSTTTTGNGYWLFTDRGRVLPYGDATSYGDMSKVKLNGPVLGSIPTSTGKGYYMVASDGGIFAFGDAAFAGSMGGQHLNAPVESLVPDGAGKGYWLVASDGGIFAFGDAPFKGSMGGTRLARPVTGMVRYADGYLMVGQDGGIFNFSTSPFFGSLGSHPPARPIVSVAALNG